MILSDEIFEDDNTPVQPEEKEIDLPNQNPVNVIPAGYNEELAKQRDYQREESNGKLSDDASAHRNVGANAYTQRNNQKDQLQNGLLIAAGG